MSISGSGFVFLVCLEGTSFILNFTGTAVWINAVSFPVNFFACRMYESQIFHAVLSVIDFSYSRKA